MPWPEPITLRSARVTLEPLSHDHHDDLAEAVQDGELYKLWYTVIAPPETMRAEIDRRLGLQEKGSMLPFAVIDNASRKAVGMTTYMNIDAAQKPRRDRLDLVSQERAALEPQHAVQAAAARRTRSIRSAASPWSSARTSSTRASRRAIERLGAKLDGILRNHQRASDGTLRDTVVYSIIESEWPTVRSHLTWQLEKPRTSAQPRSGQPPVRRRSPRARRDRSPHPSAG